MPMWGFFGKATLLYSLLVYIGCFWAVSLQSAAGMLPAGMPNQKGSHTGAKRGALHQAGTAARQGALPVPWSSTLPAPCWRRGKMNFADLFGQVKADFWAWAEQTWKRNCSSSQELLLLRRQLELICYVLTVFSQQSWTQVVRVRNYIWRSHTVWVMFVEQRVRKATGLHKLAKMKGLSVRRVLFCIGENLKQFLEVKIYSGMYLCLCCWLH